MRVLILSARLTESRRATFRSLAQGLGEPCFVVPGELRPDVGEQDTIVVDAATIEQGFSLWYQPLAATGCAFHAWYFGEAPGNGADFM